MKKSSTLLINEPPLQVLPTLAKLIGLNEAIILQQIHYWVNTPKIGKEHKGRRWVYNSIRAWQEDNFPFWSEATIKRAITNLKKQKLILTANLNTEQYDRTTWYSIDYDALDQCTNPLGQNDPMEEVKMTQPIPETTIDSSSKEEESSRKQSDLDKIKTELFDFFVAQSKVPVEMLPKEGAARNKLCYDLLLKLYGYYRPNNTDAAGKATKKKYNYDPAAIQRSKRVIEQAIKNHTRPTATKPNGLSIKSVESIRTAIADVMRAQKKSSSKVSLLE